MPHLKPMETRARESEGVRAALCGDAREKGKGGEAAAGAHADERSRRVWSEKRRSSGPVDAAGIAASFCVMRVDVAHGGIGQQAGDQRLDGGAPRQYSASSIMPLASKARSDSRRARMTAGTFVDAGRRQLEAPSRTKITVPRRAIAAVSAGWQTSLGRTAPSRPARRQHVSTRQGKACGSSTEHRRLTPSLGQFVVGQSEQAAERFGRQPG